MDTGGMVGAENCALDGPGDGNDAPDHRSAAAEPTKHNALIAIDGALMARGGCIRTIMKFPATGLWSQFFR
ncbi:hypothetical protein RvVAR0630_01570 [Agrobacterium vitis]|nr:hypothetical protein RvVAR0630_01570 [Agrobacterium vitis]